MIQPTINPLEMIRPKRKITGISAILLPFLENGEVDWPNFRGHVERTAKAGLTPAVNMDTGYVHLLTDDIRKQVLSATRETLGGGKFVAGAFVKDRTGDAFSLDGYKRQMEWIQAAGGTPVIFQSYGLIEQAGPEIVTSYEQLAKACDRFIGFELTQDLAPFGKIYDLETYAGMMDIRPVHWGETFFVSPGTRMAASETPRCQAARFSGVHRERLRHRHGDVRQRLSVGPLDVRTGFVRPPGCLLAFGRPGVL